MAESLEARLLKLEEKFKEQKNILKDCGKPIPKHIEESVLLLETLIKEGKDNLTNKDVLWENINKKVREKGIDGENISEEEFVFYFNYNKHVKRKVWLKHGSELLNVTFCDKGCEMGKDPKRFYYQFDFKDSRGYQGFYLYHFQDAQYRKQMLRSLWIFDKNYQHEKEISEMEEVFDKFEEEFEPINKKQME